MTDQNSTDPDARLAFDMQIQTKEPCPFCGHPMETRQHVKYHWQVATWGATCHTIALSHMECDACGSYITTPDQSRRNKRSILAMKAAFSTVLMA